MSFALRVIDEPDKDITKPIVCGHVEKVKKARTPIELSEIASPREMVLGQSAL